MALYLPQPCDSGSCIHVVDNGDGYVRITSDSDPANRVHATPAEWEALVERIQAAAPASTNYQFTVVDNAPERGKPCPSCCTEIGERFGPVDCVTCAGTGAVPKTAWDLLDEAVRPILRTNLPAEVPAAPPAADLKRPVAGQRYEWQGLTYVVKRVSETGRWADIQVERDGGWSKRQPLPLPAGSVLVEGGGPRG